MDSQKRGDRKTAIGVVTSDKMMKTIVVKSERLVKHAKFGKFLRKYTVYKAHDEKREAKVGDRVEIMETRPLSATKRWRLIKIVERAGQ